MATSLHQADDAVPTACHPRGCDAFPVQNTMVVSFAANTIAVVKPAPAAVCNVTAFALALTIWNVKPFVSALDVGIRRLIAPAGRTISNGGASESTASPVTGTQSADISR